VSKGVQIIKPFVDGSFSRYTVFTLPIIAADNQTQNFKFLAPQRVGGQQLAKADTCPSSITSVTEML